MDATLTGRDAAEAIGLYMRLGDADARFDARRVARAVRSSAGRARVAGALVVALRSLAPRILAARARRRSVSRRSVLRLGPAAAASPGRPRRAA